MPAEYEWIAGPDSARIQADTIVNAEGTAPPRSISACLVVRNEGALIRRCLESLTGAVDEIIVVHDGPCEDDTLTIAEQFGCRVFVRDQYGHCERHLPFAYQQARGEWLLTLDADEFLSTALRTALPSVVAAKDVNGYELLWPLWDGRTYISRSGPYKLALARRSAMRMVGIIHSKGEVDGVVKRIDLQLEHQSPYNNFTISTIVRKWGPRARLQAREYLSDLNSLPRFNYPGRLRWTDRREWMNRWAALLIVPAALHTFFYVARQLRTEVDFRPRIRFAFTQAIYRGMVTGAVAWERVRPSSRESAVGSR